MSNDKVLDLTEYRAKKNREEALTREQVDLSFESGDPNATDNIHNMGVVFSEDIRRAVADQCQIAMEDIELVPYSGSRECGQHAIFLATDKLGGLYTVTAKIIGKTRLASMQASKATE